MSDLAPPSETRHRSHSNGGFLSKVKKGFQDTTTAAGIELQYVNHKRKGFVHEGPIEEIVEIYRHIRKEIPDLRGILSTISKFEKASAEAEDPFGALVLEISEGDKLHPHQSQVYKHWANKLTINAASRFTFQASLDNINEEWKLMETHELTDLHRKQDMTNKSMSDSEYWKKKNPAKSKEYDMKYQVLVREWCQQIHELRAKKEDLLPQYILRALQAEVLYLRAVLQQTEATELAIRQMGPCTPHPVPNLSHIGATQSDDYGAGAPIPHQPPGHGPPPPVAPHTPSFPQARGLYEFAGSTPQELSFHPGDVLSIVSQDGQWWTAELQGRRGLIPSNYVQLL